MSGGFRTTRASGGTGALVTVPAGDPAALARALAAAPARALLSVPEGTHRGPFVVRRDVTIRGAGPTKTVLSGGGLDTVLALVEPGARLRLSGVSVQEGAGHQGGGLALVAAGRALLEDCVFVGCRASSGGGAIYVAAGELAARRVLVHRCASTIGGGVLADEAASVALDDVVIEENDASEGGGICLRDGARLSMRATFVRRNGAARGASALEAHASLSRAPAVEMEGGALAGGRPTVRLIAPPGAARRPTLAAKGATLATEVQALPGFTDGGGCRFI